MNPFSLSQEHLQNFKDDGYFIVEGLFDDEEMDLLRNIARRDLPLAGTVAGRRDGQGGVVKLSVSNELGDDVYAAIVRSRRIVNTMEQILDGEVYHYHHKMILKDPFVGGAWEWHQDYGYWYHNGCLFPHLASCMIAVDRATRENGCLEVLRGSHLVGRIEHGKVGDQTGADIERVEAACARLELVSCELAPGRRFSFTATCCTGPPRIEVPSRAGRLSAATMPRVTTPTKSPAIPAIPFSKSGRTRESKKSAAGNWRL